MASDVFIAMDSSINLEGLLIGSDEEVRKLEFVSNSVDKALSTGCWQVQFTLQST